MLIQHPDRAIAEVKRLMGTDVIVDLAGESFTPQEISALILRHIKQEAERVVGEPITEAVITVPAQFTNVERQATRDAGELAGFVVRRLINEPTAAALAYGLERPGVEARILVYDLGGGTLDVTLLELSEGVIDVLSSTGNTRLGGKTFDERLENFLRAKCIEQTGVDMHSSPKKKQTLKSEARRAKEELSTDVRTVVSLDNIGVTPSGDPISFAYTLSRAAFEAQIDDLVSSTREQIDEALRAKGIASSQVDTVLLVGGSTRIPLVRQFVESCFGANVLRFDIDPDEAVTLGAAVLAGIEQQSLDPTTLVITDVAPHTLGVAVTRDNERGEAVDGLFDVLISKQSTIPRTATKMYQTAHDGQSSVRVQVYQGDAPIAADNQPVGEFVLDGLPPVAAGAPLEIEFSYNLSGELDVVARAKQWSLEKRVTMRASSRHLSSVDKIASRKRLEAIWNGVPVNPVQPVASDVPPEEPKWRTSRQYSRVAALMAHAERRLPTLAEAPAARVATLIRSMRAALARDDESAVDADERALTDVLFDLS